MNASSVVSESSAPATVKKCLTVHQFSSESSRNRRQKLRAGRRCHCFYRDDTLGMTDACIRLLKPIGDVASAFS